VFFTARHALMSDCMWTLSLRPSSPYGTSMLLVVFCTARHELMSNSPPPYPYDCVMLPWTYTENTPLSLRTIIIIVCRLKDTLAVIQRV
jgi:hypothetical protein